MEPQPPPTRKRKRADTQDVFEEKVANLSLDDFPTPPGVNSFGGVDGQKFAEPRDAASAGPFKENQIRKKKAPANEEEKKELYKLDLSYFKALYNAKSYEENEWPAHAYWCRRKFWEHYYRADLRSKYPEAPESPENQMASLREGYANHRPPWWFPGFPDIEKTRTRFPTAWRHYENAIPQPPSPDKYDFDAHDAQRAIEAWKLMTNEQLEMMIQLGEPGCLMERERINATTEVIEEYNQAIQDVQKRCGRWEKRLEYHNNGILRAKAFLNQRRAEELAAHEEEPARKKRRTD
ncbi:hypothetical protein VC83_05989 [Pseudogymnoascus destructans]|uniref:Uncharacterized protein n=2 Tax=Pseudogymnoascus destructans TaxID=655981 RepID=L8G8M6_PSED2|nr:uncharacterized protein VC83_05989 [Pseudogymnoascus destructans]ELR08993.1 hypothetical protein GMDG_00611 [Pseudogymnoascus destructans 20631-21]OAF56989.1 hypothetical protein VC83_05989 [Pseudogymnoascus destructans]